MPGCRYFLAALLLAAAAPAQLVQFTTLSPGVLEDRLRLATPSIPARFARLRSLFEETGCPALAEQKLRGSKEPNLICRAAGEAPEKRRIIVGAHFDCAGGDGVVDNWTGAILLPSLAEFIRQKPRRHAFEFIGFAAEEKGLLGSAAYLKAISKADRANIAAVITMDSLGLTPTKFSANDSSPELVRLASNLAQAMHLEFTGIAFGPGLMTDSQTFFAARIPTLSLHSVNQQTLPLINSSRDVWASLSWKDYYDTHRFISALLTYLDEQLP